MKIQTPASAESERKTKQIQGLTEGDGVVDPEAAEHPVNVAGVAKAISPHHNLEGLCKNRHWVIIDAEPGREWSLRQGTSHRLSTAKIGSLTT